jgi:hypothetical protein
LTSTVGLAISVVTALLVSWSASAQSASDEDSRAKKRSDDPTSGVPRDRPRAEDADRASNGIYRRVRPFNFSIARFNDRPRRRMSAHTSPTVLMRAAMLRIVNVCGATSPRSTSFHVQGADTGAPGFARMVYAAANVAL